MLENLVNDDLQIFSASAVEDDDDDDDDDEPVRPSPGTDATSSSATSATAAPTETSQERLGDLLPGETGSNQFWVTLKTSYITTGNTS